MPVTTPLTAAALLTELTHQLDLPSWQDPEYTWFSSSAPTSNPGKRYHAASWCPELKAKEPVAYVSAISPIADQLCRHCFGVEAETVEAHHQHLLTDWLTLLAPLALAADAGQGLSWTSCSPARAVLTRAERHTGLNGKVDAALELCSQALGALVALGTRASTAPRTPVAVYAARLLAPEPSEHTAPGTDTRPAPVPTRDATLLGAGTALTPAWEAFGQALRAGKSAKAAATAARLAMPASPAPFRLSQLKGLAVTATHAGQAITLDDLTAAWRDQTSDLVTAIIGDWERDTEENIRNSAHIGTLRVTLNAAALAPYAAQDAAKTEVLNGAYPTALVADGGASFDLPAALAFTLLREVRPAPALPGRRAPTDAKNIPRAWLTPTAQCPAEMLDIAASLHADGLSELASLLVAQAIIAAPQALAA